MYSFVTLTRIQNILKFGFLEKNNMLLTFLKNRFPDLATLFNFFFSKNEQEISLKIFFVFYKHYVF